MAASREHKHQKAVVDYFRFAYPQHKKLLFSIPNGGHRDVREGARLKAEGCRAGVPDLLLCVPTLAYPALFIEMKAPQELYRPAGKLSDVQREMIAELKGAGYRVEVCFGSNEAITVIDEYLA